MFKTLIITQFILFQHIFAMQYHYRVSPEYTNQQRNCFYSSPASCILNIEPSSDNNMSGEATFKLQALPSHKHNASSGLCIHQDSSIYELEQTTSTSFDRLLLTPNFLRPQQGTISFYVRVFVDHWSPWLLYAVWNRSSQYGSLEQSTDPCVRIDQDTVIIQNGQKATRFGIKALAEHGACLQHLTALHVCVKDMSILNTISETNAYTSIALPLKGISQYSIASKDKAKLCSPTSTTAVIRYIDQNKKKNYPDTSPAACSLHISPRSDDKMKDITHCKSQELLPCKNNVSSCLCTTKESPLDPLDFAHRVFDEKNHIYGNWALTTAQAYMELGEAWYTWAEYLDGFSNIYASLQEGVPCVMSIRSPLPGSAKEYKEGHLIVIIGYDATQHEVLCMDPAFPVSNACCTRYRYDDLMKAWSRRNYVAYMFLKKTTQSSARNRYPTPLTVSIKSK